MGTITILNSKFVSESPTLQFDANSMLASGEAVTSAGTVCTVFSGTDPTPGNVISGSATVLLNVISQKVTGGLPGVIYLLRVTMNTNQGNVPIMLGKLAVLTG